MPDGRPIIDRSFLPGTTIVGSYVVDRNETHDLVVNAHSGQEQIFVRQVESASYSGETMLEGNQPATLTDHNKVAELIEDLNEVLDLLEDEGVSVQRPTINISVTFDGEINDNTNEDNDY